MVRRGGERMTKVVVKVNALLPNKELLRLKERLENEAKNDNFVILPHFCSYTVVEEPVDIVIEVAKEYDAERT